MRKSLATLALLGALMMSTSCVTGPWRWHRAWDDYTNQKYTESTWIHGVLLSQILPFYPLVGGLTAVCDAVVLNTWTFWTKDAFDDGHGTGYDHKSLSGASKTISGFGME